MAKHQITRWLAAGASAEALAASHAFREKVGYGLDLSGIRVGMSDSPPWLAQQHFDQFVLEESDLSRSHFSCVFSDCRFARVSLQQCVFESCRMTKSRFTDCDFTGARLLVSADGAHFADCVFVGATFSTRGNAEYGGRRILFERCNFEGAKFQRVELRAAKFLDCSFSGAQFDHCDLRGAKFDGAWPSSEQLDSSLLAVL